MTGQPVRSGETATNNLSLQEIITLGEILSRSGFFADSRDPAQSVTKILAGKELGFGAIASMTGVYIVKGRVTLSANLIAAAIKRNGRYDYRVKRLDTQACEIEFLENGEVIGVSTFTMQDARAANLGGENWNRYPRNMLFARAISNGAKWHCPDVFGGPVYTPEELGEAEAEEAVAAPAMEQAEEAEATEEAVVAAAAPVRQVAEGGEGSTAYVTTRRERGQSNGNGAPGHERRAQVRCAEWNDAARALALRTPHFQKDGKPDYYRMTSAAGKLGFTEITTANLPEVLVALEKYGLEQQRAF